MTVYYQSGRIPPAAALLGWRYLGTVNDPSRVRIALTGSDAFCDLAGNVHGGLLAAMLEEVITTTIAIATGGLSLGVTISINVQILRSVAPGPLVGEGSITLMGRNISFSEAQLLADGSPVARANGCCRLVPVDPKWGSATVD
ncbi:PaaI family thioesterase [Sphingomonas qilianensis]|uniref:PaaI family thioesterase n=1 Tax=Sphingomonas qilianensis TaxID=1736690 RepID=A0ABU9XWM9_9SPHN